MRGIAFQILFLLQSFLLFGQVPAIEWSRTYGGGLEERAESVKQTADGGYIVAGASASADGDVTGNHGFYDYWVLKLDANGEIEWQKALGGSVFDAAESIFQTSDGGYIIAGGSISDDGDVSVNKGESDVWIVKLNSNGDIEWEKSYGGSGHDFAYQIIITDDGGYAIAGFSASNDGDLRENRGDDDFWIIKTDEYGNLEWQKSYGGSGEDRAKSIAQAPGGGYIVAGHTESFDGDVIGNHGGRDYWVLKLDSLGELQWQRALGGSSLDYADSVINTSEGGYIVAGTTYSDDGDLIGHYFNADFWIVKLDTLGEIEWQSTLGGWSYDIAREIQQMPDGGFIVTGISQSADGDVSGNHGDADFWVVRLDAFGNLIWQKAMGGSAYDGAHSIDQTADGGFIIAGVSSSDDGDVTNNHIYSEYWVVKLGSESMLVQEFSESETVLFPNPASEKIYLNKKLTDISIFDLSGKLVLKPNSSKIIDIASLSYGIYILTGTTESGQEFSQKFIKK